VTLWHAANWSQRAQYVGLPCPARLAQSKRPRSREGVGRAANLRWLVRLSPRKGFWGVPGEQRVDSSSVALVSARAPLPDVTGITDARIFGDLQFRVTQISGA